MKLSKSLLVFFLFAIALMTSPAYAQDSEDVFTIGFWNAFGIDAFKEEMANLGYEEGVNVVYLYTEDGSDTTETAQALIDAAVDVIVTSIDLNARSLRELTQEIPIVFEICDDPVATGIVEDLVRPGTNATGNITSNTHTQKLQILSEIDPTISKIYIVLAEQNAAREMLNQSLVELADELGIETESVVISDLESALDMLENIPDDVDWLFMTPFLSVYRVPEFYEPLIALARERHIGIAEVVGEPVEGMVMGYGPDLNQAALQAADVVDRILRGADPADLPIQSVENSLMVNLEEAALIGLDIPVSILRRAQVIVRPGFFEEQDTNSGG